MSNVLIEELGPRGKARVRIVTWVSLGVLALVVAWVLYKLGQAGQLEAAKWTELFEPQNLRFLGEGLLNTIKAALSAGAIAIILGLGLALSRISRSGWARAASTSYVEFFRALPLLLTIFMAFFGTQALGVNIGIFWSAVLALVLYNSAVLSEIYRAGIASLDKGQTEAAQAIGLRYWPMMRLVILPQAIRRMIPAIVAQMATLTKDVSLAFVISYPELVRRGTGMEAFSTHLGNLQAYVFVALIYFILIWALARLAEWLDSRQFVRAAAVISDEVEDVVEQAAAG